MTKAKFNQLEYSSKGEQIYPQIVKRSIRLSRFDCTWSLRPERCAVSSTLSVSRGTCKRYMYSQISLCALSLSDHPDKGTCPATLSLGLCTCGLIVNCTTSIASVLAYFQQDALKEILIVESLCCCSTPVRPHSLDNVPLAHYLASRAQHVTYGFLQCTTVVIAACSSSIDNVRTRWIASPQCAHID